MTDALETQAEKDWRPRLSIDLNPTQVAALQKYIPWGLKTKVFSALVDLLIAAFERGGAQVLVSVIEKELDLPSLFIKKENV